MKNFIKTLAVLIVPLGLLLICPVSSPAKQMSKRVAKSTAVVMPYQFRGYIDHSGTRVLPVPYDWFGSFHEGLAAFRDKDKKYGFINRSGSQTIKPQFDDAKDFSNGLAAVKLNDSWGFVDHTGRLVIKPTYQAAGNFTEGLALVFVKWFDRKNNVMTASSALVNRQGSIDIPYDRFDSVEGFREGVAIAQKGGDYFYVDSDGIPAIETKYKSLLPFYNGVAIVWLSDNKVGFIDRAGRLLYQTEGQNATPFCEGLSIIHNSKGNTLKFLDLSGKVICQLSNLDFASRFSEGCAIVGFDELGGLNNKTLEYKTKRLFVDRKGHKLIADSFQSALPFSEGLAAVNFSISSPYSREERFENQEMFPDMGFVGLLKPPIPSSSHRNDPPVGKGYLPTVEKK